MSPDVPSGSFKKETANKTYIQDTKIQDYFELSVGRSENKSTT